VKKHTATPPPRWNSKNKQTEKFYRKNHRKGARDAFDTRSGKKNTDMARGRETDRNTFCGETKKKKEKMASFTIRRTDIGSPLAKEKRARRCEALTALREGKKN